MFTYKKVGKKYILSLQNGVEIVKTLNKFCSLKNIKSGVIHGIGSVDQARLRFYNAKTKDYDSHLFEEPMEIASLIGNISEYNKDVYLHIHITLGCADYRAIAGHLLSATISGTGEFVIEDYDAALMKHYNSEMGLNYYDFE